MKYFILLVIFAIIIVSIAGLNPPDNTCHLKDVPTEEIMTTAQSLLAQLNGSEYFQRTTVKELTWYFHNEPKKMEKWLGIYRISESFK